jgi:hypothetical protein
MKFRLSTVVPAISHKFIYVYLLLILSGCASCANQSHQETASPNALPNHPIEARLEPYMGRLKQLQIQVGSKTLPFLFDTGGELTLVDPEVTALIGCEPYGRLTGFQMSGQRVEFQQCGRVDLRLGGLTLRREVGVFDLMALLPEDWPRLSGVLSLHTFRDNAITLDLANNRLIIETEKSLQDRVRNMQELRMHIARGIEGRGLNVYLVAKARRGSIRLLLDSGNLAGFILAPHAIEQLGLELPDLGPGADNTSEDATHDVILDIVGLGPVSTAIISRDIVHDGAISAEFLEKLILTMDFRSNRVWARFHTH